MSPDELRRVIDALDDDPRVTVRRHRFAVALKVSPSTVASWLIGRRPVLPKRRQAIERLLAERGVTMNR